MKKLGYLALLLSVAFGSLGCEPAKKGKDDKKPADKAPADKAPDAAPADKAPDAAPPADKAPDAK